MPFTVVTGGPLGPDITFVGRTSFGPWHFDDPMVVRVWEPPHRCVMEKAGYERVLRRITFFEE